MNYAADTTYDFVPAGDTPVPRDVVRTADCNQCHGLPNGLTSSTGSAGLGRTAARGAACSSASSATSRRPWTRYALDVKVFIHKIHMGSFLPSVQAGTPYQIIGFQNSVNGWSTVVYPAAVRRCQTCHNPKNGASQTEYCVLCHNPSNTDASARAMASNPAHKAAPPQGINFALMLHKIHTALNLRKNFGQDYVVVGFGTTVSAWRSLRSRASIPYTGFAIPQMGANLRGAEHGRMLRLSREWLGGCAAERPESGSRSTGPSQPIAYNNVGPHRLSPEPVGFCTPCGEDRSEVRRDCDVCHGTGAAFGVTQVHAG